MTDEAMSPLRRRMIEDMTIRKFGSSAAPDRNESKRKGERMCANFAHACR